MRVPNTVQTEQQLKNTLDLLYAKSKEGKSFTGILELVANEQTIITAIHKIKANKGSKTPGIDGKTINHYLQMPKRQLIALVRRNLYDYQPKPIRRKFIAKKDSDKLRPLGIPSIMDRITQECLRTVLEPILEAKFYEHSYGFRPYRSTKHAVATVVHKINRKSFVAIEGDIKGFFDHVNHRLLIKKIERLGIIDKRITAIIKKMLKAKIFEADKFIDNDEGTPQGGILSPLLANAYLNDFDWTVARMYQMPSIEKNYSNRGKAQRALRVKGVEPKFLTRYADDWIIQTTSTKEASKLLKWLQKYFQHRLKLELSQEKTLITDSRGKPYNFLGYCIKADERRKTPDKPEETIVAKVIPNPKRVKSQIKKLTTQIQRLYYQTTDISRAVEIEKLNSMIIGIAEYWKVCIAKKTLSKLDNIVNYTAYRLFCKTFGDSYRKYFVPIYELSNYPQRHLAEFNKGKKRLTKTWAIQVEGKWIGITKAHITPIQYAMQFNQKQTPYSIEGRKTYLSINSNKKLPLARLPLYDDLSLVQSVLKDNIYNFEYMMNREYAFNQTLKTRKGEGKIYACQACGEELLQGNRHCHHKNSKLPMDEINKVKNLIWLCSECHMLVERGIPDNLYLDKKRKTKIEKLRSIKFSSNG